MDAIEKARAIRDAVVAAKNGVTRVRTTVFDAEHDAWRVDGDGWHALVINMWDFQRSASAAGWMAIPERSDVIWCEILELVVGGETVVSFGYEIDGPWENLLEYVPGAWEAGFGLVGRRPAGMRLAA